MFLPYLTRRGNPSLQSPSLSTVHPPFLCLTCSTVQIRCTSLIRENIIPATIMIPSKPIQLNNLVVFNFLGRRFAQNSTPLLLNYYKYNKLSYLVLYIYLYNINMCSWVLYSATSNIHDKLEGQRSTLHSLPTITVMKEFCIMTQWLALSYLYNSQSRTQTVGHIVVIVVFFSQLNVTTAFPTCQDKCWGVKYETVLEADLSFRRTRGRGDVSVGIDLDNSLYPPAQTEGA